jgi:POT family proton-dependent oligopeptide transporter
LASPDPPRLPNALGALDVPGALLGSNLGRYLCAFATVDRCTSPLPLRASFDFEALVTDSVESTTSKSGHPKGLYVLFGAEMFERVCYYGMRALLVLYLTKALLKGDLEAFGIYGAYTALVYAAPVAGGKIADSILGYRRAVIFGGLLMAIGEFMILGGNEFFLFAGMAVIIIGNGYFKANISTIVGRLYEDGDPRRDSGFTIFYMGINLGAFLATAPVFGVGPLGERFGFTIGFGIAGVGMLLGIAVFILGTKHLQGHGEIPDADRYKKWAMPTYIGSIVAAPLLFALLKYGQDIVGGALLVILLYVVGNLLKEAFNSDEVQRDRIFVLLILMVFNVTFWACFEQAGSSLTLFADRNVDRNFLGIFEFSASGTQSFNPIFILLLGSIFTWMWVALDRKGMNPNIPMKFGIGILQLGIGYLLILVGVGIASDASLVPIYILLFMYMLHTMGELFLSPIGLSMVTKLAPKHMTGSVMGAWFLSFAFSNYLAAMLAKLTGGEGGGGGGPIEGLLGMADKHMNPPGAIESLVDSASASLVPDFLEKGAESLNNYADTYSTMGYVTVGIGILLILLSKPLNKMMHGVK